jgi:TIR domain
MANSSKAIFLSYASQDAHAAQRICDALRAAGLEVWFDQSDLRGGEAWDAAIRKQVKECALFMPLISANTEARSEGYFRREWNLAVNRMLDMAEDSAFLVPIIVDDTPESGARVPERFRERQWTRLPGGAAPAEFAERIRTLLVGARASDSTTRGTSAPLATNPRTPADEGFWVAVLPFKCGGSNTDLTALTDALSEEITTGLGRPASRAPERERGRRYTTASR